MSNDTTGPLEPKLYFANERTFLHWMHASLTLTSVGMVLVAMDDDSPAPLVIGVALSLISVLLIAYAYRTFIRRIGFIRSRSATERVDDPVGPVVLAAAVIVALVTGGVAALVRGE